MFTANQTFSFTALLSCGDANLHYVLYAVLVLQLQFCSSRKHSVIIMTKGSSASARTSQRTSSRNSYSNRVRPFIVKYYIRHDLLPFSTNLYVLPSIININCYHLLDHYRPPDCDSFIHSKGIMYMKVTSHRILWSFWHRLRKHRIIKTTGSLIKPHQVHYLLCSMTSCDI